MSGLRFASSNSIIPRSFWCDDFWRASAPTASFRSSSRALPCSNTNSRRSPTSSPMRLDRVVTAPTDMLPPTLRLPNLLPLAKLVSAWLSVGGNTLPSPLQLSPSEGSDDGVAQHLSMLHRRWVAINAHWTLLVPHVRG